MSKNSSTMIDIGSGLSMMIGLPRLTSWTTANRPKHAKSGTLGFNYQTKSLEYSDGTFWFTALMSED